MYYDLHIHTLFSSSRKYNSRPTLLIFTLVSANSVPRVWKCFTAEIGTLGDDHTRNFSIYLIWISESIDCGFNLELMAGCDHLTLLICGLESVKICGGRNVLSLDGPVSLHDLRSNRFSHFTAKYELRES